MKDKTSSKAKSKPLTKKQKERAKAYLALMKHLSYVKAHRKFIREEMNER